MAQGIQVGDAVLKMFVDWTEINSIATELPSKLKPGTDAAASLGTKFDSVGKSAGAAGTQATAAGASIAAAGNKAAGGIKGADDATQSLIAKVKSLESESAKLQLEIQQLQAKLAQFGQEGQNAGRKASSGLREAKGEAALLGELTGVRLPRHVRSFVAELPGLSTALSAAFEATAVIFLIEAVVQLGEKIEAFLEKPQKIADAWDKYRNTVFESGQQIRGEIDKEEQKLIEMAQGPVAALDFALKHLQTTAAETFKLITGDITDAVAAMKEQAGFGNVFGDAAKDLEHFESVLKRTMREAEEAHPDQPLAAYNAAIAAVQQKERDLTALIKLREAASGADSSAATSGLHAERQAINELLPLLQQGIKLDEDRIKVASSDKLVALSNQLAEVSKRNFDNRIAQINQEKAAQELLYAQGKISILDWAKAQGDAARSSIAGQLQYKEALLAAAKASGESTKVQAAAQELALEKTKQSTAAVVNLAMAFELVKKVQAELKDLAPQLARVEGQVSTELTKGLDQASAAAQALGFTFTGDLYGGILKAQEAYEKLQKSGHATYADLLQGQIAVLRAQIAFNSQFHDPAVEEQQKHLAELGKEYDKLTGHIAKSERGLAAFFRSMGRGDSLVKLFDRDLASSSKGMRAFGEVAQTVAEEFAQAWETAIAGAILGQKSFGEALQAATAEVLAQISAQSLVYGLFYTAQGIADLFWDPDRAAADFTAAAEFFALSAVTGIAAHAINPGPSYSASGNNTSPDSIGANSLSGQQPTTTQNVDHFGSGAVVNRRMLAVVGDNPRGGHATEAIIPLDDDRAKQGIADKLVGNLVAAFSGVSPREAGASFSPELVADIVNPQPFTRATLQVAREATQISREGQSSRASQSPPIVNHYETHEHNHSWNIEGVISDDNLTKVMKKMSDHVSSGKARLKSSTTYRVTKRG